MYEGVLLFGCTEIVSASRAYWYTRTSECPIPWLRLTYCDNLAPAFGEEPYDATDMTSAPWYDEHEPASLRFFGSYPLSISGLSDSTRTATVVEGILDGGVITGYRNAVRTITVRAFLIAEGQDALEYGLSWLDAALRPDECSVHGVTCGEVDLQFFVSCPPLPDQGEDPADYEASVDSKLRMLHGVVAISGPTVTDKFHRDDGVFAYIVEFVLAAAKPYVYTLPSEITIGPLTPDVAVDSPINLAPYPSAELRTGSVVVATNYSTNPSVETNNTGWAAAADGSSILTANCVSARSTLLSVVGTASELVTWTAPGSGASASAWFAAQQAVTLPALAGARYSLTVWGAGRLASGTAVLGNLQAVAYWRDASNATLRMDMMGTIAGGTGVATLKNVAPPAGATNVLVRVAQYVTSWSSGAVLRCFADALAVTVP